MELIAILIVISISLHVVWRDCVFLCTMLKNKIMGKGKKDEKDARNDITKINDNISIDDVCRDKC